MRLVWLYIGAGFSSVGCIRQYIGSYLVPGDEVSLVVYGNMAAGLVVYGMPFVSDLEIWIGGFRALNPRFPDPRATAGRLPGLLLWCTRKAVSLFCFFLSLSLSNPCFRVGQKT